MSHHWNHILWCSCRLLYVVFWMHIWGSCLLLLIPFESWIMFPVRARCSLSVSYWKAVRFWPPCYTINIHSQGLRGKKSPHLDNSYTRHHIIAVSHDKSAFGFISNGQTVLNWPYDFTWPPTMRAVLGSYLTFFFTLVMLIHKTNA